MRLSTGQSYSSFVLLPMLNFATRKRCLFIGGPGRGKTASAVLMGVLAGYPLAEVRRGIQHGQPQMTIADLLGNPLPRDLLEADSTEDIRIAWRKWLSMRVEIVDEYNRIPTRTQSALLTLLADGYADDALATVVRRARAAGTRVRLSCVLLRGEVDDLDGVLAHLDFARSIGVDNVIVRQLMRTDPASHADNFVVRYGDRRRVALEPLLERVSADPRFSFRRQIVGYYYYVEVWRAAGVDVVFEEADLAQLERSKRDGVVHELVFHPSARLGSTWQPWDGVLGPPEASPEGAAYPSDAPERSGVPRPARPSAGAQG